MEKTMKKIENINRTLSAATIEVLNKIAEETAHTHKTLWGKPGVESYHRIGSEICHIVRDGETKRKGVKDVTISKAVREELALVLMDLGEDCGHHSDHTYRKIGRAAMMAVVKAEIANLTDDVITVNDDVLDDYLNDDDVDAEEVDAEEVDTDFRKVDDEVDEEVEVKVDLPPDMMENLINHLMENLKSDNE